MNRRLLVCKTCLLLGAAVLWAHAEPRGSLTAAGWTISADPGSGTLDVTHEQLGALMRQVRLHVREANGSRPFASWTIERSAPNQLILKAVQPQAAWLFELRPNLLKISTTLHNGVITAQLPASKERIPARLLDPLGVPADWVGTNEVAEGYGGKETRNPSFLPRKNADCMYFALGQIASPNFTGLFDRRTDVAISFPDETRIARNTRDQDLLDLTMPVSGSVAVRLTPDYYTRTLGLPYYIPFDDSYFKTAPIVWSSWTSYYEAVSEADIIRNTDWLATNLKPYGFQYVQLDDGYDRGDNGEHSWIENWDKRKFPHGPQWLTSYITSKGLRAGIWLVPNSYASAVEQHPDWYLRFKNGNLVLDYQTPALDSTNPEVLDHLRHLFQTLDGWGFEYYKFDGEHALTRYVPNIDCERLKDKTVNSLANYRDRLRVIRETIGPNRFIEGCPAGTPLNGIGYFDSYFNGHDLYNSWQGMYALFSSITANAFLNHIAVYVMPGEGLELGTPMTVEQAMKQRPPIVVETARTRESPMIGFGTTLAEARTLVTYVSLTGVAYPLASVMPELPEERVRLLKATMPTLPILPVDLFSRGTDVQWDTFKHTQPDFYIHNYPEILNVKVNGASGVYDIVGLTNWRSATVERDFDLTEKLGLDPDRRYVVFDFWNQKLLGIYKKHLVTTIEPHDTRVLFIHPLSNRPQLVGISRHISGAYSILEISWDEATRTLHGSSQTVPGDPYLLWFYVPDGMEILQVRARARGRQLPARHKRVGHSLMIRLDGQQSPVAWEVAFTRTAPR